MDQRVIAIPRSQHVNFCEFFAAPGAQPLHDIVVDADMLAAL
jgi:hypothetical protein